jgi:hypothetical protein
MESSSTLLWSLLFGCIGLGYFSYGRRQKRTMPFVCGLLLMVFPYFIANLWLLVGIGSALAMAPYFIRY